MRARKKDNRAALRIIIALLAVLVAALVMIVRARVQISRSGEEALISALTGQMQNEQAQISPLVQKQSDNGANDGTEKNPSQEQTAPASSDNPSQSASPQTTAPESPTSTQPPLNDELEKKQAFIDAVNEFLKENGLESIMRAELNEDNEVEFIDSSLKLAGLKYSDYSAQIGAKSDDEAVQLLDDNVQTELMVCGEIIDAMIEQTGYSGYMKLILEFADDYKLTVIEIDI